MRDLARLVVADLGLLFESAFGFLVAVVSDCSSAVLVIVLASTFFAAGGSDFGITTGFVEAGSVAGALPMVAFFAAFDG